MSIETIFVGLIIAGAIGMLFPMLFEKIARM